jgi:DNA repair protein RadA/Sms
MAKVETRYVCQACGHAERKWLGRCPACLQWSSFVEERAASAPKSARTGLVRPAGKAVKITEVDVSDVPRTILGLGDLDRVLGGGLVQGSLTLIGGEPGVGKSTLLLEVGTRLASANKRTLYVSAEESTAQTRLRAERLGTLADELYLLAETDLQAVMSEIERVKPGALILDSVQTVYAPELDGAPGTVTQVREVTSRAMQLAKQQGLTTFLVGHVTKEGALAGPRMLEHMVDTVLSFEASRGGPHRVLRATKNRFGSTNELAVFEMQGQGLLPVDNPSALFLAERPRGKPGSVVAATLEGSRALLVEVQALAVATVFGQPRRTTTGIDNNRVALLSAVLERRAGLSMVGMDLFVNVAGGAALSEPAADLSVALAIASSVRGRPVDAEVVCFGEVGLAGEVRGVSRVDARLEEAARLGFVRAIVPVTGTAGLTPPRGLTLLRVASLDEALSVALDG